MDDGTTNLGVDGVWIGSSSSDVCTFHLSNPVDSGTITFWWWATNIGETWTLAFDGITVFSDPALDIPLRSQTFPAGTSVTDLTITHPLGSGNGSVFTFCLTSAGCFDVATMTFVGGATDTTAPVVTVPANMTVEATSASGAAASFSATATDETSPANPVVTCLPVSGSTFPLGTTPVNCSATDTASNTANGSFNVTVTARTNLILKPDFTGNYFPYPWVPSGINRPYTSVVDRLIFRSAPSSVRFTGSYRNTYQAGTQTVKYAGLAGDTYSFGIFSRAENIPVTGLYKVEVLFYNKLNQMVGTSVLNFNIGTHDFEMGNATFTAPANYSRILLRFVYQGKSGKAWFDDAFLYRLP